MNCERITQPRGADFTGVRRCSRKARWVVRVDGDAQPIRLCTGHRNQAVSLAPHAVVRPLS